jgi:cytidylate kinase
MAIITISRGSASGGLLLAQGLSEKLGYAMVGREDVIQAASTFGVAEEKLQEALLKPLGFWERFQHERRRYLTFVQRALCERARNDRLIYHGNAGHLLLCGISHVLCVRLIAPLEFRIRMLMEREGMIREDSMRYIERMDRQRSEWTRFLYGVDWNDPSLYDLTINLQTLDVDGAVELVAAAVHREQFKTTEESQRSIENLCLASRVRAALAADNTTSSAEVDVKAEGDVIHLKGKVRPVSLVDAIIEVATRVEGVREVDRRNLDAPDYRV